MQFQALLNGTVVKQVFAIMFIFICSSGYVAAHTLEYLYNQNLDGTFTFNAATTIHSSAAGAGTGFLFNGNAVSFDNETLINDVDWDAMRAAANGAGSPSGFDQALMAVMLDVTLDFATLTSFGMTLGNTFTIDTFDSPTTRWASISPVTLTFSGVEPSAAPEPGTLILMVIALGGLGVMQKNKFSL